ncbi:hypothetical protein GQ600_3650 [Phytophthora cactorum]|nr:hypothetical protein GQ600_3650 [Phytophthora cactorum]
MEIWVKMVTFWLLDMPSVAMAALHGYFVLFAVRLVFRRRWPGMTTSAPSGVLTAVFIAFCVSLVALVTLVAICRAEGDKWGLTVPQWMTFGYTAVIRTTLGLLMIKYVGQAVRILWRYRRQHHWNIGDEQDEASRSHQRLPVLSISCLKNMTVCSTILAELLVVRGVLCAVTASKSSVDAVDVDSWRFMTFHYVSWEITSVVIVLCMLHKTPIAVHCFSDTRSAKKSQQDSVTPSAPAIDSVDIQVEFQVPGVRELVSDYVVPSNVSLLSAQRRRMEHENIMEPRYCRIHHNGTPSSGDDGQVLGNANVPLLAKEYEPLTK